MSIKRFKSELVATLLKEVRQAPSARVDFAVLAGLPAPVIRYLKQVLQDGQPLIRLARVRQTGKLRTGSQSARWLSFEADQVVAPLTVGFIWDAKVTIVGPLHLRVLDAYVMGRGFGRVSIQSALTVASDSGAAELNSGALHRYLAEAVWYPTALLPTSALRWSPIDEHKALATLSQAGQTVALEFWFNEGRPSERRLQSCSVEESRVASTGRPRGRDTSTIIARRMACWVPARGEVGWYVGGQWERVWAGEMLDSSYDFAR